MRAVEKGYRNITLIGLTGSGKTALGKAAAEALGLPFVDVDEEIEKKAGMKIAEIFRLYGEAYFRDLETAQTREAAGGGGAVIATGGGVVTRAENIEALRESSLIVFLDRSPESIAEGIDLSNRPMLAGGASALFRLSEERRPLYLAAADVVLPCDCGQAEALGGLLAAIRSERPGPGFAVIGDPIRHTLSPLIHRTVFDALAISEPYEAIHVPRGQVGRVVERARASGGLKGFNITMPHKKDIIPFLDELDEEAVLSEAVNTVVARGGKLCGFNTDMQGLAAALRADGAGFPGRRVVIIGTGGAAGAIALKAVREEAGAVAVLGRREGKAREICESIEHAVKDTNHAGALASGPFDPETTKHAVSTADILINATPLGMDGFADDFESTEFLAAMPMGGLVVDIVYNPQQTKLLRDAAALGLKTQNGLGMLIYQALLADELFLGRKLDRQGLYRLASDAITLSLKRKEGAGR